MRRVAEISKSTTVCVDLYTCCTHKNVVPYFGNTNITFAISPSWAYIRCTTIIRIIWYFCEMQVFAKLDTVQFTVCTRKHLVCHSVSALKLIYTNFAQKIYQIKSLNKGKFTIFAIQAGFAFWDTQGRETELLASVWAAKTDMTHLIPRLVLLSVLEPLCETLQSVIVCLSYFRAVLTLPFQNAV